MNMQRRHLKFDDVRSLHESGYQQVENWDLAQMLSHLNLTMKMAVDGSTMAFPAPLRGILKLFVYRKMARGDVVRFRAKAPVSLQPAPNVNLENEATEFERLCRLIDSPVQKLIDMHPAFGRLSKDEWKTALRWHASHHLSFLLPNQSENAPP